MGSGTIVGGGVTNLGLNVPAIPDAVSLSASFSYGVAVRSDGTVVTWGPFADGSSPTPPEVLTGVTAVSAGPGHCLALKSDGTVRAWGAASMERPWFPRV